MSKGGRERVPIEHGTRYHFRLFLISPLYYIIMMRHDMGWEIPEQETARRQDWLGWVLGRKGGMMTCTRTHTHIYLMPTQGDTSEFLSYIRTHVREMDAFYIILNNEYTRDLLVAGQPRSLIVTCE